ncbi:MAG: hypothetical protein AB7S99_09350 [Pseudodonghicola sp.]
MTQDESPSPFGGDPEALARLWLEMLPPDVHVTQLLGEWLPADQLNAIKELLQRNHQAAEASRIKFDELRQQLNATPDDEQLNRLHDDRFWSRVFMDSAHSMSAVGMLAPFMESLFVAIFAGLRRWQVEDMGDVRRQRADDQFWNPQIYFEKDMPKTNLVKGIQQLAGSCGLQPFLPAEYEKTLAALFAYRNNMFHNGFLWSAETISKFSNRVASEKWPDAWFASVDKGGKPWLYYMSPEFCDHCIRLIDEIMDGTGRYLKEIGL